MPEGPTILLLTEEVHHFAGRKVLAVEGNAKTFDQSRLLNQKVIEIRSWGKHFLICFKKFTLRVHFLLFGSYAVDQPKDRKPRLHLKFTNGDLYLYSCSVRILEGSADEFYEWSEDVLNPEWNASNARKKVKQAPDMMVCDTLLSQEIFAGVGNIIKNEVLYRIRIHPESLIKGLTAYKLNQLVREARQYSFDFLEWKRQFVLKKHWLAHTKKICARCKGPIIKKITGKFKRRSFFCPHCQPLYT